MIKYYIFAFLTILSFSCKKEEVDVYQVDGNKKNDTIRSARRFLFLGDSQMNVPGSIFDIFNQKEQHYNYRIALGGRTSSWLIDTLFRHEERYTDVVIFIGTNDIYQHHNINILTANILNMIILCKERGAERIAIYQVPPSRTFIAWDEAKGQKIKDYNTFLEYLEVKKICSVIHIYDTLSINDALPIELSGPEGLHVNWAGNLIVYPEFKSKMNL